jgi:hypothetical protein
MLRVRELRRNFRLEPIELPAFHDLVDGAAERVPMLAGRTMKHSIVVITAAVAVGARAGESSRQRKTPKWRV